MSVSNDKSIAVAFIGEIFNIEEIAVLNNIKVSLDADLILQLYQRDLLASFSIANGLFCACIFDGARNLQKLITDRYGSFPIYYYIGDKRATLQRQFIQCYQTLNTPSSLSVGLSQLFTLKRTLGSYTNIGHQAGSFSLCCYNNEKWISLEKYWHLKWVNHHFSDIEIADACSCAPLRSYEAVRKQKWTSWAFTF